MPKFNRDEYPVNSIVYKRNCPYCGRDFWGNKPSATYCSAKCRVYANKAKREAGEPTPLPGYASDMQTKTYWEPTLIGSGSYISLLYDNPYQNQLEELDPDGSFGRKHLSGERVRTLEEVIAYHMLTLQGHQYYSQCLKDIFEEDKALSETKQTDEARAFLLKEQAKSDKLAEDISNRIQQIILKSSDPAYVPW